METRQYPDQVSFIGGSVMPYIDQQGGGWAKAMMVALQWVWPGRYWFLRSDVMLRLRRRLVIFPGAGWRLRCKLIIFPGAGKWVMKNPEERHFVLAYETAEQGRK